MYYLCLLSWKDDEGDDEEAKARRRKWKELEREKRDHAIDEIEAAIKDNSIFHLKKAIQLGRDANMEGGRGVRKWISPELQDAYKELERMENEEIKKVQRYSCDIYVLLLT